MPEPSALAVKTVQPAVGGKPQIGISAFHNIPDNIIAQAFRIVGVIDKQPEPVGLVQGHSGSARYGVPTHRMPVASS